MKTMTLMLGDSLQYEVGCRCARMIDAEITTRRLRRVGIDHARWLGQDSDHAEVCAMMRAMPPGEDRREMRGLIKYQLRRLLAERSTPRRWQDYVRLVAAGRGVSCPATNDDPAWEGFVLPEKQRAAA